MPDQRLLTPVVLIIFNRPETTERVFAQIAQAKPAKLLVIADGPRTNRADDASQCAAARAIVDQVDWDCEMLTNYAETNLGCRRRISSGLDWAFEIVDEAIILEDDCVPHPDFFPFCSALLDHYRADERVMMIGGTNFMLQFDIPESYLFSRYFAIWGWATWRRAWEKYDVNMTGWEALKAQRHLEYCYPQRYMVKRLTAEFDAVYRHQVDTWDLQWVYCCLFNNGLSVVPRVNLISNIGLVGTHTFSGMPDPSLPTFPLETRSLQHPKLIFANSRYDNDVFEKRLKMSLVNRVRRKVASLRRP